MSNIARERQEIFERIFVVYEAIKDILIKAGIKEERLPNKNKLEFILLETHINKMRHTEQWLAKFIVSHVTPWKKVRGENSEKYWADVEALGWGTEFQEVKRLKILSKKIKVDWFSSHNFLTAKKDKAIVKPKV